MVEALIVHLSDKVWGLLPCLRLEDMRDAVRSMSEAV